MCINFDNFTLRCLRSPMSSDKNEREWGEMGGKLKENLARNLIFVCADRQNAQSTWNGLRNLAECPVIGQKTMRSS